MSKTSVQELVEFGQSIWLDYISRSLIKTGELEEMIHKGLRGMTSNPTIFEKAITKSSDYDERIRELRLAGRSSFDIYDDLTIKDVQNAADAFMLIFKDTNGFDGYVSLEINPELAMKARETVKEGKRLYHKVDRPNVMFKVPATDAGFEAVEELLGEGININVTLIFSKDQYEKTAMAYLNGMKKLSENGGDVTGVRSVASVFVSRIDTAVDRLIEEKMEKEQNKATVHAMQDLRGKAAAANANIIYATYLEKMSKEKLREKGILPQRVLWGSTGTKNPTYSDIKYVTELIAKNTVNTVPENTFNNFLAHGIVREALTDDVLEAKEIIHALGKYDIDIDKVCETLLKDGVAAFTQSFQSLLHSIEDKVKVLC